MELPYNIDAEKQVLANMLFSQDILLTTVSTLDVDDFFDVKHKTIFKALKDISKESGEVKIEPSLLIDRLSINGDLERAGDAAYILDIASSYTDLPNSKYYIDSVEEKATLRKLIISADYLVNNWQKESAGDISDYINKIEKDVASIASRRRIEDFVPITAAFEQYKERVARMKQNDNFANGLTTGYSAFDKILLGFKPGEVTILAARPAVGKSALALNFLFRVADRFQERACAMFSIEMGIDQVTNRIISSKSGVPLRKVQTGTFDKEEEIRINKAIQDISKSKLYIDQSPVIRVADIKAKLNKLRSTTGDLGLVVIDYIGLVKSDTKGKGEQNRALELGEISAGLHALAREFNCPFLVLAQLNRGIEDRSSKDKQPKLSDIRESGNIEQDADVVLFIHRPDYQQQTESVNKDGQEVDPNAPSDSNVQLIIAKNRTGQNATIDYMFQKHIGRFVEMDVRH